MILHSLRNRCRAVSRTVPGVPPCAAAHLLHGRAGWAKAGGKLSTPQAGAVYSGEWTADSREWTTPSSEWTDDSTEWTVDPREWTVDSREWTADSREWSLDSKEWTVHSSAGTTRSRGFEPKRGVFRLKTHGLSAGGLGERFPLAEGRRVR